MSQMEFQEDKQEIIIEAALKRFAHYGPSKTTMNEIADDLHLSKALIYYYFPDKANLLKAVLEKILHNYFSEIECEVKHAKSVEKALMNLTEVHQDFFAKYFLNMGLNRNFIESNKGSLDEIASSAIEREKEIIARLFQKANETGELLILNPKEKADLYIDMMKGIRFSFITPGTCSPLLDHNTLKEMHVKIKLMTEIFIKAHRNTN